MINLNKITMIVYIHRRAKFFCLDPGQEELKPPLFGIGYTLEDYFMGKFVKLNEEQIAYWQAHPDCSPIEAFNAKSDLEPVLGAIDPESDVSGSATGSVSGSLI